MAESALSVHGDIDSSIGNLQHHGSVKIHGSVLPGMKVEAQGDVLVTGEVTDAELQAGGDLTVLGLVTGSRALLDAVGTATFGQAADARIVAGVDIEIHTAAERCHLLAGGRIRALGVPGVIRGGRVESGIGLEAKRVLTAMGRPTEVRVGWPLGEEELEDLEERLAFTRRRAAAAAGAAARGENGGGVPESFRRLVATLERRRRQLRAMVPGDEEPFVHVRNLDPRQAGIQVRRAPKEDHRVV